MFHADRPIASMHHTAALTGGWALTAAGVLALPLPGPFTTPAFLFGGLVLVRRSRMVRHGVAALRARFIERSDRLTLRSRYWPRAARYVVLRTDPRRVHPRARGWELPYIASSCSVSTSV
jgi:hypothetical protein